MMNSRTAISRGRTFVKSIMWSALSRGYAPLKDTPFFPEPKGVLFQLNEVYLAADVSKHS